MRLNQLGPAGLLCTVTLGTLFGATARAQTDSPAPHSVDEQNHQALAGLAAQQLRLSTDTTSLVGQFGMLVAIDYPISATDVQHVNIQVSCDGANVHVLGTTDDGCPIFYMQPGLLLRVDSERPGVLDVFEGGAPELNIGTTVGDRKALLELNYRRDLRISQAAIDFSSLLQGALTHLLYSSFDPSSRTYVLHDDHSTVAVEVMPKEGSEPMPIRGFEIQGSGRNRIRISNLKMGSAVKMGTEVTIDEVHTLDVPLALPRREDLVIVPVIPDRQFREQSDAAEKALARLLDHRRVDSGAATQPDIAPLQESSGR